MDLTDFFKLIKRHKLTLIIIPLITVIVTYYLVRNLPDSYTSSAQMSTGIVDQSQQLLDGNTASGYDAQVQQFSNLITFMQMKKTLNQVSYQLILHDLKSDKPFRKPSKEIKALNKAAKKHAIDVFTQHYQDREDLSLFDKDQQGLNNLLNSMHYDNGTLGGKVSIFRNGASDYIHVEYESENPDLSAFIVNTLIQEFISSYTTDFKENQQKAVTFLAEKTQEKKKEMDDNIDSLKQYKIANQILNLNEEAKSLYAQIADNELRKEQAEKDVESIAGTLRAIDGKFNPADRKYFESSVSKINGLILGTRDQLKFTTDLYVKSNYAPKYKQKIDSLQSVLNEQVNQASDQYAYSPLQSKNNLMSQKLTLEISYDLAKYSLNVIDKEITRLKDNLKLLGPHEAVIQSFENEIDVATKAYLEMLNRYNETSLQSQLAVKLRQVEYAMPGGAQPSKKMLLVILSGIISVVFCMIVLFILFYLDNSITQPRFLANKTGIPVLGYISIINSHSLDLKKLWNVENRNKMQHFKDQLRSIRFEIDQDLKNDRIVAITSLDEGEGKTLLAISLAYSYSVINKKVLLIDGNFNNPTISNTINPKLFIEEFFRHDEMNNEVQFDSSISVLGNRGNDITLLEIDNQRVIKQKFDILKLTYDVIIIDAPAMSSLNKSKEWLLFADKAVLVFEANQIITEPKNAAIKYLKLLDHKFSGWVFNKAEAVKTDPDKPGKI